MPGPEHMGIAVGISLLSCIRTEIHVFSYLLPVNGRHLWFTTYPNTEHHHYFLRRVLWHWKRVIAVEIVLLSCKLAEIRVITLFQPPTWISDFRFCLGVLLIALLKSLEAEKPLGGSFTPLQHKSHKNNLQHMRVNISITYSSTTQHNDCNNSDYLFADRLNIYLINSLFLPYTICMSMQSATLLLC